MASQQSAAAMAKAAGQFLDSLTPEQRAKAAFPFTSDDRLRWHFIPNEMFPRKGMMIKDMSEAQRRLAHDLLRSGLSARGYQGHVDHRARRHPQGRRGRRQVRAQQGRVFVLGVRHARPRKGRGAGASKGITSPCGSRSIDGAVTNQVASSPMFLGSNPAEVRDGEKKGLRVLGRRRRCRSRARAGAARRSSPKQAIINAVGASRHPDDEQERHHAAAGSRRLVLGATGQAAGAAGRN